MKRFGALGLVLVIGAWAADNQPQARCRVTGTILNSVTGEPLGKAEVTLRGGAASDVVYTASTDEAGAFFFFAADAKTYELVIRKRGFVQTGRPLALAAGQPTSDTVIRLTPQGIIAGRVSDGDGEPLAGVVVQAIQSRAVGEARRYSVAGSATTNDLGEYRIFGLTPGRYYLGGAYRRDSGYAAVYYPGAAEASQAAPIDVRPGGELRGLNLAIRETHSLKIHGALQSTAAVALQGVMIVAAPCDDGPLNRATTTVRKPDGLFELRDLTPGCYLLAADSFSGGRRFSARLPIHIAEANIDAVQLNLVPPIQLTGLVRAEGDGALQMSRVAVNLESRFSRVTASGSPAEDGGLTLNNIVPESYHLSVAVPDGYYLKSARFGEADVLSYGLDLSRGSSGRLEIVLSGDGGAIEGVVADDNTHTVEAVRVALVPEDPATVSSQIQTVITDRQGRFRMRGIKPGNYRVYASQSLDVAALRDPIYAKRLEPHAHSVSVQERSRESIRIKILAPEALPGN